MEDCYLVFGVEGISASRRGGNFFGDDFLDIGRLHDEVPIDVFRVVRGKGVIRQFDMTLVPVPGEIFVIAEDILAVSFAGGFCFQVLPGSRRISDDMDIEDFVVLFACHYNVGSEDTVDVFVGGQFEGWVHFLNHDDCGILYQ